MTDVEMKDASKDAEPKPDEKAPEEPSDLFYGKHKYP